MMRNQGHPPSGLIERRGHDGLLENQLSEHGVPGRRHTLSSLALFAVIILMHGNACTFEKLRILKIVPQCPDQAWESVACRRDGRMTTDLRFPERVRRVHCLDSGRSRFAPEP